MAPSLNDVQAVGCNGIPLDPCVALNTILYNAHTNRLYQGCLRTNAVCPFLVKHKSFRLTRLGISVDALHSPSKSVCCVIERICLQIRRYTPDGYDLVDLEDIKGEFGSRTKEGIVIELRFLAYNDMPPYQFSVSCTEARNRLISIEQVWIKSEPTSALDTAFWDACHERFHHPRCFLAREAYLGLVADDQISKLTIDSTEKMERAARTAKADMIGIESILERATEELENLGLDRSLDELLDAEIEHTYQTDPELRDTAMSVESAGPSTTRKRPPPSARVPRGTRDSMSAFILAGKRQHLDRVVLADKTNYFPRPYTNTSRKKKIAVKREPSLGDQMARLTHAQQDMIHAGFSKVGLCLSSSPVLACIDLGRKSRWTLSRRNCRNSRWQRKRPRPATSVVSTTL